MSLLDILRWLITLPLLLVSGYFIITNLRFLIITLRVGLDAGPAPVTIMGGLTGSLGLLIIPVMSFGERLSFFWLPLVLDIGSLPFYGSMLGLAIIQYFNAGIWRRQPDYIEGGTE